MYFSTRYSSLKTHHSFLQKVKYIDWGRIDYQTAWDEQQRIHKALIAHKLDNRGKKTSEYEQNHHLIFCEHPHVYTLGRSGDLGNLLLSEVELLKKNIQYFPINRGGDITYHGPGQVVGYPLLDLDFFFTDVHKYVRYLEEMVIRTIAEYGIEGFRIEGYTGVWVTGGKNEKLRKICAIGVHLSRWVTLHGFAFNVDTDLSFFEYIVPCGIVDENKTVTSLSEEVGRPISREETLLKLKKHFESIFECKMV